MKPARRAVIDVGTNSVKLLVADALGHEVRPVWEESQQTRLGKGFYEMRELQPSAIAQTAQAVARFAEAARAHGADSLRVIATSAARDARNPEDLLAAVHQASGLPVQILSGEQEADWAFRGVTTNPELARAPLLLLDVGGGSTQFILGQGDEQHFRRSVPLGTVRLLEQLPHGDPPTAEELAACQRWLRSFLQKEVVPELEPALRRDAKPRSTQITASGAGREAVQLVGTGGTATILGRMARQMEGFDREQIEATRLSIEQVQEQVRRLWSLPLAQRKEIRGLPANRADVILMGVAIYEAVMAQFQFPALRLSTRGLRFAAVMDGA